MAQLLKQVSSVIFRHYGRPKGKPLSRKLVTFLAGRNTLTSKEKLPKNVNKYHVNNWKNAHLRYVGYERH